MSPDFTYVFWCLHIVTWPGLSYTERAMDGSDIKEGGGDEIAQAQYQAEGTK